MLGLETPLATPGLAAEDPDQPESAGEADHEGVEQEIAELILITHDYSPNQIVVYGIPSAPTARRLVRRRQAEE